jgi:hypothetical protein
MTDHFDRGVPPHLELGERGEFALRLLAEKTTPETPLYRSTGVFAFALASAMEEAGIIERGYSGKRHGNSQGAANTLVALKRRGLARNSTPGGEAFQSVEWGITEKGVLHLKHIDEWLALRADHNREEHDA